MKQVRNSTMPCLCFGERAVDFWLITAQPCWMWQCLGHARLIGSLVQEEDEHHHISVFSAQTYSRLEISFLIVCTSSVVMTACWQSSVL
jgi:hypothetical protein